MLIDLLGKGFEHLSTAFHLCHRPRTTGCSESVAGLHPREVLVQALPVALLVLELGEGKLPLASLALYLLPKALGLVDDLLVLLVASSVEPAHHPGVPGIGGRSGLQYTGLAPVLLDAPGDPLVGLAIVFGEGEQADRMLQREGTQT